MSSNFVGKPSIPSDNLLIARSESSVDSPKALMTFGNVLNVSNRLIAEPIELASTLKAAAPIFTNPNEIAMSLIPLEAVSVPPLTFLASSPNPLTPFRA